MPCVIEFTGGDRGPWRVTRAEATAGARLEEVAFVSVGLVSESEDPGHLASSAWHGVYAELLATSATPHAMKPIGYGAYKLLLIGRQQLMPL